MRKASQILALMVLATLLLPKQESFGQGAAQQAKSAFDFRVERSIWGANPLHDIHPENQDMAADTGDYHRHYGEDIVEVEKVDLGDINVDIEQKRKQLMKEMMRKRQFTKTMPLLNDNSHTHAGLSVELGMGNMKITSDFGSGKACFSPTIKIDYIYFFNQDWGCNIGVGIGFANTTFKNSKPFEDTNSYIDVEGDSVVMSYSIKSVEEKLKLGIIEIPLMAAYTKNDWLATAGFKFKIPISLKYDQKLKGIDITAHNYSLNTEGQWYQPNPEVIDNPDMKPWGIAKDKEIGNKVKMKEVPVLIAIGGTFGRRFRINDMFDVAASVYVDYSLSKLNIREKGDKANKKSDPSGAHHLIKVEEMTEANAKHILVDNNGEAQTYVSGITVADQMSTGKKIVDKMSYFNLGLKVAVYFNTYGNGTEEAKEEVRRKVDQMQF